MFKRDPLQADLPGKEHLQQSSMVTDYSPAPSLSWRQTILTIYKAWTSDLSSHFMPEEGVLLLKLPQICGESSNQLTALYRQSDKAGPHLPDRREPGLPSATTDEWLGAVWSQGSATSYCYFYLCLWSPWGRSDASLIIQFKCFTVQGAGAFWSLTPKAAGSLCTHCSLECANNNRGPLHHYYFSSINFL